ncbi:MAG: PorP/SprF family type IX secretion system membrane protein [Saprospiraceae bacterium]|nr:PorP/SprF family type IX secretion system membrane protein [Saprospiraceae bacterium]
MNTSTFINSRKYPMKNLNIFLFLIFATVSLTAQNNKRYFDERYISGVAFMNPVIVNPGATGYDSNHSLLVSYKNTWATHEGSPKSLILSYDGPIADRLGLGGMLLTDTNGDLKTTKLQGSVSYTIDTPTNKIGFGLSAEYIQHGLSADVFGDPLLDPDPRVNDGITGTNFFDVSFGVYGLYNGKLTYGLALPSLVSSRIDNGTSTSEREIGYLLSLGYMLDNLDSDLVLEPSIMVKKLMNVDFHADINLLARFLDDKLRGGITYTVGAHENLGFIIGTSINTMNFTYSYGASRNEFQRYNNGSHELTVRFDIGGAGNSMAEKAVMEDKINDK